MQNKNTVLVHSQEKNNTTRLVEREDSPSLMNHEQEVIDFSPYSSTNEENPFLLSAKGLFQETHTFLHSQEYRDIDFVMQKMKEEMNQFEVNLNKYGGDHRYLQIAKYMMCTFCDELIGNALWNKDSRWAEVGLLNYYYKESYGGDKFFQLIEKFTQEPMEYIDLLELAFVCLSFGFGGRYKQQNRLEELNILKEKIYKQTKGIKLRKEKFYIDHPHATRHYKLYSKLSDKVILGAVLLLVAVIYMVFTFQVESNENPLVDTLVEEHQNVDKNIKANYVR